MRDLYCYDCSLQFDKIYVFNNHLSVVHGEKLEIKQKSDSQTLDVPEAEEIEINHPNEKNISKIESISNKICLNHNSYT